MIKKMKKISFMVLLVLFCSYTLFSQAPQLKVIYHEVQDNLDTISTTSINSNWWFGPMGGVNYNYYFGEINTNFFPEDENPFNFPVNYTSGSGADWFAGFMVEYLPVGKQWGGGLDVYFPDLRHCIAKTEAVISDEDFGISYDASYRYIVFNPYVRYNIKNKGLHVFAGFSVGINTATDSYQEIVEELIDDIYHNEPLHQEPMTVNLGGNLGAGWDIMMSDIYGKIRMRFTPYMSINYGTPVLHQDDARWNTVMVKAGLKVKIGITKSKIDTSKYKKVDFVPRHVSSVVHERTVEIVLRHEKPKIYIPTFELVKRILEPDPVEFADLETPGEEEVEIPDLAEVEYEIPETAIPEPKIITIADKNVNIVLPSGKEKSIKIVPNKTYYYTYPGSKTSEIPQSLENFLDELGKQMKSNPNWLVYVDGHSDNAAGNTQQKMDLSVKRAQNTKTYLVGIGAKPGRVFPRGRSDLRPLMPNTTAKGRQANRRVEIRIIAK